MTTILHVTHKTQWELARKSGQYVADSLFSQGFIHCSTPDQVISVADCLFKGQQGLVLLSIDTDRIQAVICYENLEGGTKLFPHVYGAIDVTAVTKVYEFQPRSDGTFELPEELTAMQ